jgi:cytochrome c-type biogenesis protein CcmH
MAHRVEPVARDGAGVGGGGRTRRRIPWWTVFGVVGAVALLVGSGVLSSRPLTAAQRSAAIEADIRCPSCEDLSVAQSDAPTAVAVRAAIHRQVDAGRSDQQVEAYLMSRYGASIELDPPASGLALVVWLVPLVAGVVGLAAVATVLVRRHLATSSVSAGGGGAEDPVVDRGDTEEGEPAADPDRRADRRGFLLRSLADADAEYLAGDLSDRDYLALRRRDMGRLAALEAGDGAARPAPSKGSALAVADHPLGATAAADAPSTDGPTVAGAGTPAPPRRSRRSRRSWWYLAGAVAAFAAALIVAVTQLSSARLPGQTPTGSVSLSPSQQTEATLAQAAADEDQGQVGEAATLYESVLVQHPANEVALAQLGWIEFETGHPSGDRTLLADARVKLERAVQLDPQDYAARLYLGTVLFQQDGDAAAAVAQFRMFLAEQPPAALVSQAAPVIRQAYGAAGDPAPAGLPGGS